MLSKLRMTHFLHPHFYEMSASIVIWFHHFFPTVSKFSQEDGFWSFSRLYSFWKVNLVIFIQTKTICFSKGIPILVKVIFFEIFVWKKWNILRAHFFGCVFQLKCIILFFENSTIISFFLIFIHSFEGSQKDILKALQMSLLYIYQTFTLF